MRSVQANVSAAQCECRERFIFSFKDAFFLHTDTFYTHVLNIFVIGYVFDCWLSQSVLLLSKAIMQYE